MKKKFIVILIIIVIIILGITGVAFYQIGMSSEEKLIAIPHADKNIARVGEIINFTGKESKGDIKNYIWNFGDGNISSDENPSHIFSISNWYNVTLFITNNNGKEINSTLIIGIQCSDGYVIKEEGADRNFRPQEGTGTGLHSENIGPNIGQPTIEIQWDINQPFGSLEIYVLVGWGISNDGMVWGDYIYTYREDIVGTGRNIRRNYIIQPEELPEETKNSLSKAGAFAIINEGRWSGIKIQIHSACPMENLEEPNLISEKL